MVFHPIQIGEEKNRKIMKDNWQDLLFTFSWWKSIKRQIKKYWNELNDIEKKTQAGLPKVRESSEKIGYHEIFNVINFSSNGPPNIHQLYINLSHPSRPLDDPVPKKKKRKKNKREVYSSLYFPFTNFNWGKLRSSDQKNFRKVGRNFPFS